MCLKKIGDNNWISETGDPWFVSNINFAGLSGWWILEACIESSDPRFNAVLYMDYGSGFNEDETILLPAESGKTVKRFILLRNGVKAVRFDPLEGDSSFKIMRMILRPVTAGFAKKRVFRKISNWDLVESEKFEDLTEEELLKQYTLCFQRIITDNDFVPWTAVKKTLEEKNLYLQQNLEKVRQQLKVSREENIYLQQNLEKVRQQLKVSKEENIHLQQNLEKANRQLENSRNIIQKFENILNKNKETFDEIEKKFLATS